MTDSEMLDFMAEYVDTFIYIPRTKEVNGTFVLHVAMVGRVTSQFSLRDAIEKANDEMQKVNS